ncbi:probable mediator of RNA polymerase II transcription subunit 26b isoform X1 [Musa acuminata AAA Group]|uniref:probable mediator of RNA polymerase II transcription subunit 26b isoform X1 n=1 Tax=Musa acuminata AAA Group TaxID=214697 RepID=UPI0031CEDA7D
MADSSGSLDYWRKFFRSANSDIFEVIEHAVLVAASDYPEEFRSRRDRMVENLFTVLLPRCFGCDRVAEGEEGNASVKRDGEKESKVDSNNVGPEDLNRIVSNYSFDEAEALTEEMEEEGQIVGEVLRIKEIFANHHDESESTLFESLRRLQLMELSVELLKATEIGKAVNGLRKHNSKQIRHLVRTLIDGWKVLVEEWVRATAAIAVTDNSPDNENPPIEDEEGLPSPPLDEGALFATQTTSIQLSEFFDGMDDDGNFRTNGEFEKQWKNGRMLKETDEPERKQQPVIPKEKGEARRQELVIKPAKPQEHLVREAKHEIIVNKQSKPVMSGPGRQLKLASNQKAHSEMKTKQHQDNAGVQRKPSVVSLDKTRNSEEALIQAKLEVAKRKLHEGYQLAENTKKQRTIQVMELHDLPKQAHNRHPILKSRNQSRSWASGRH